MAAFESQECSTRGESRAQDPVSRIAELFGSSCETETDSAWNLFVALPDWSQRESVVQLLAQDTGDSGCSALTSYKRHYRQAMRGIISEAFYSTSAAHWAQEYATKGEVNVPLLDPGALSTLAAYAASVEGLGKARYGLPRPCYPPGEVALNFPAGDPRKDLFTDVNMTAVGSSQMTTYAATTAPKKTTTSGGGGGDDSAVATTAEVVASSPVHWIYHSPHLRAFLCEVMGSQSLHPYLSDLGVAVNIMRPPHSLGKEGEAIMPLNKNKTALGFHFDSIDSSARPSPHAEGNSNTHVRGNMNQPRGATGVIGIQDCIQGGERIVFPSINRSCVDAVRCVTEQYDPKLPHAKVGEHSPVVVTEPTAGYLFLFNGGDVLHGVSGVREGVRIAAVFLFQEDHAPVQSLDSDASSQFFYNNVPATQETKEEKQ